MRLLVLDVVDVDPLSPEAGGESEHRMRLANPIAGAERMDAQLGLPVRHASHLGARDPTSAPRPTDRPVESSKPEQGPWGESTIPFILIRTSCATVQRCSQASKEPIQHPASETFDLVHGVHSCHGNQRRFACR